MARAAKGAIRRTSYQVLSDAEFQASKAGLIGFIKVRGNTKLHLTDLM